MLKKYGTATQVTEDNKIRSMSFARRINKATDTHSEYVIVIAFRLQQLLTRTLIKVTFMPILPALFTIAFIRLTGGPE